MWCHLPPTSLVIPPFSRYVSLSQLLQDVLIIQSSHSGLLWSVWVYTIPFLAKKLIYLYEDASPFQIQWLLCSLVSRMLVCIHDLPIVVVLWNHVELSLIFFPQSFEIFTHTVSCSQCSKWGTHLAQTRLKLNFFIMSLRVAPTNICRTKDNSLIVSDIKYHI